MRLLAVGFPFHSVPVAIREKLALTETSRDALTASAAERFRCEAMCLSTCNRFELHLATADDVLPLDPEVVDHIATWTGVDRDQLATIAIGQRDREVIKHLLRVTASLDSLVVGEGQIAAQVKSAFDAAKSVGATGPVLHALVPHALKTAKRIRTDTGIARGHVSVSSVAVDFAKQVFDRFDDKSVLVIGAGKMAKLTLKHLQELSPREIVLTNRSPEKAAEMAGWCGGRSVPWERLSEILSQADIVLSATGAPSSIVTSAWFDQHVRPYRRGALVVLDIAVPRDFDPTIHDGDAVCVFNIDDLTRVREQTLDERRTHIAPAESIVENETTAWQVDWQRRRSGPVIRDLTTEFDRIRKGVVGPLLSKWNGKLSDEEKRQIDYAFRLFQNQLLHGPIAALQDASKSGDQPSMLDTLRKLFRLGGH